MHKIKMEIMNMSCVMEWRTEALICKGKKCGMIKYKAEHNKENGETTIKHEHKARK